MILPVLRSRAGTRTGRRLLRRTLPPILVVGLVAATAAQPATAAPSIKKAIWGPVEVNGQSQFPIYRDLGVGILEMPLSWAAIAVDRPQNPRDPSDPAYRWPPAVDSAISQGRASGIEVMLVLVDAPGWANGGRPARWAARDPADAADFAEAAARRYPAVRHWMVYDEPSRQAVFMPLTKEKRNDKSKTRRPAPLTRAVRRGPELYARILDASYAAFKRVRSSNLVIGGNTFTTGDVSPFNFIRAMRLPNGRPPRMDLFGHNPFTARRPKLGSKPPMGFGLADFSDLEILTGWVDRYLKKSSRRPLRLFLAEFSVPSDHPNYEFNFYVSRKTQASWLASAFRIVRGWKRIYSMGWHALYDDPPRPDGRENARGLLDYKGNKKPSYNAYKRG